MQRGNWRRGSAKGENSRATRSLVSCEVCTSRTWSGRLPSRWRRNRSTLALLDHRKRQHGFMTGASTYFVSWVSCGSTKQGWCRKRKLIRGGVERHTCQVSNLENLQDKTFKCVVRWELIPILLKLLGVPELDDMWYAHYPKVKREKYLQCHRCSKGSPLPLLSHPV